MSTKDWHVKIAPHQQRAKQKTKKKHTGFQVLVPQWLQLATLNMEGHLLTLLQLPKIQAGHLTNIMSAIQCLQECQASKEMWPWSHVLQDPYFKSQQCSCCISYRWIPDLLEIWYKGKCSACVKGGHQVTASNVNIQCQVSYLTGITSLSGVLFMLNAT